jgi:hypothetical protein
MKSKLGALVLWLAVSTCLAPVSAWSDTMGLSVNGTCDVGSCPPSPLAFNSSASTPFSFNVTLANGDLFLIAGTDSQTNCSNAGELTSRQVFTVQYLSGPNGVSQADSLNVATLFGYESIPVSQTLTETDFGSFNSGVASGSAATILVSVNSVQLLSLGPFTSNF